MYSSTIVEPFSPEENKTEVIVDDEPAEFDDSDTLDNINDQTLDNNKLSPWIKKKLSYVFHNQIIPSKLLPTFNSIVIESFLHLIPGKHYLED